MRRWCRVVRVARVGRVAEEDDLQRLRQFLLSCSPRSPIAASPSLIHKSEATTVALEKYDECAVLVTIGYVYPADTESFGRLLGLHPMTSWLYYIYLRSCILYNPHNTSLQTSPSAMFSVRLQPRPRSRLGANHRLRASTITTQIALHARREANRQLVLGRVELAIALVLDDLAVRQLDVGELMSASGTRLGAASDSPPSRAQPLLACSLRGRRTHRPIDRSRLVQRGCGAGTEM